MFVGGRGARNSCKSEYVSLDTTLGSENIDAAQAPSRAAVQGNCGDSNSPDNSVASNASLHGSFSSVLRNPGLFNAAIREDKLPMGVAGPNV